MQMIWEQIEITFAQAKEAGSYFLFYLLALGLGLMIAWDRYGTGKTGDNWMVEEAKKRIQLWPFLFGLISLLLVVANPIGLWILNKIFPFRGQAEKLWPLLLFLFLIVYGVVCFVSLLGEQGQKNMVVIVFVFLIGLAGSCYGLLSDRQGEEAYSRESEAVSVVKEIFSREPEHQSAPLLAPAKILEYTAVYEPGIQLLYGKDMYMPYLDLGIMDTYPEELSGVYEAMQSPRENLELLSEMAQLFGCGVMVLDYFETAPSQIGQFVLYGQTQDYLIYKTAG